MKPRNEQVGTASRFRGREGCFAKSEAVPTFSDYGEIGVVADLFGLPEVAAVVSGHVRQEGAQGHFGPLERPRSLGSGQVEAVGFLNGGSGGGGRGGG